MVTHAPWSPETIDFSTFPDSDGLPMADNEPNLEQMVDLILQLKQPLEPAFRGYQFQHGRATRFPNPTGNTIRRPLLGLELRIVAGWLRVIDPETDAPYPLLAETLAQLRAALSHAREERAARLAADDRATREAEARQTAEAARQATEAARKAADERIARLEAELRAAPARPAQQADQDD